MKNLAVIITFTLIATSCSKKTLLDLKTGYLEKEVPQINASAEYCSMPPKTQSDLLFFGAMIDDSGSNGDDEDGPGTDNDGTNRVTNLAQYLSTTEANPKKFYTAYRFNCPNCGYEEAKDPLEFDNLPQGGEYYPYSNDLNGFINALNSQNLENNGATPGLAALEKIKEVIINNATVAKLKYENQEQESPGSGEIETAGYVWAFASDGVFTDGGPPGSNFQTYKPQITTIMSEIMELPFDSELGPFINSIVINTVYYFDAQNRFEVADKTLAYIAELGQGDFFEVDLDAGKTINWRAALYQKETNIPTEEVTTFIVNNSMIIDRETITYESDFDMDGLSDRQEIAAGSNPFLRDSDGNDLSDYYENVIHGAACQGLHIGTGCNPSDAIPTAGCGSSNTTPPYAAPVLSVDSEGNLVMNDSLEDKDGDGLLDCEEAGLGSNPENPDSNKDFIPDGLAFKLGLNVVLQADPNNPTNNAFTNDSDDDGVSDGEEIQNNTHPLIPNHQMPGIRPLIFTKSAQFDQTKQQTCFKVDLEDLGATSTQGRDVFTYWRWEVETVNTGELFLLRADKQMENGTIEILNEDFKLYGKQSLKRSLDNENEDS
jgi:hypothetical protein